VVVLQNRAKESHKEMRKEEKRRKRKRGESEPIVVAKGQGMLDFDEEVVVDTWVGIVVDHGRNQSSHHLQGS